MVEINEIEDDESNFEENQYLNIVTAVFQYAAGVGKYDNTIENDYYFLLPALLNNPLFPKEKQTSVHVEALLLYLNTLKCANTYSQYTWADKPIISPDGALNPPFAYRMLPTAVNELIDTYINLSRDMVYVRLRERKIAYYYSKLTVPKKYNFKKLGPLPKTMPDLLTRFLQVNESNILTQTSNGYVLVGYNKRHAEDSPDEYDSDDENLTPYAPAKIRRLK